MRSALVKSVDIDVTCPGTCIEPRDGFLDLEKRSIPFMIKDKEKYTAERIPTLLTKLSIIATLVPLRHYPRESLTNRIDKLPFYSVYNMDVPFHSFGIIDNDSIVRKVESASTIQSVNQHIFLEINFIQEQLTHPKLRLVCAVSLS